MKKLETEMMNFLVSLLDELEDRMDTDDGDDGTPVPNWAMRTYSDAEALLGLLKLQCPEVADIIRPQITQELEASHRVMPFLGVLK